MKYGKASEKINETLNGIFKIISKMLKTFN
jgi:hypothetical protein